MLHLNPLRMSYLDSRKSTICCWAVGFSEFSGSGASECVDPGLADFFPFPA